MTSPKYAIGQAVRLIYGGEVGTVKGRAQDGAWSNQQGQWRYDVVLPGVRGSLDFMETDLEPATTEKQGAHDD